MQLNGWLPFVRISVPIRFTIATFVSDAAAKLRQPGVIGF
jgi:hypothetical protein